MMNIRKFVQKAAPSARAMNSAAPSRGARSFSSHSQALAKAGAKTQGAATSLLGLATGGLMYVTLLESQDKASCDAPDLASIGLTPGVPSTGSILQSAEIEAKRKPEQPKKVEFRLPNPGKFDEIARESKDVLEIQTFIGARFTVGKSIFNEPIGMMSPQAMKKSEPVKRLILTSNVWMGAPQLAEGSVVDFSANCQLGNKHILMASMASGNRVTGKYVYNHTTNAALKTNFQIIPDSPQYSSLSWDVDYKGQDFCAGANYTYGGIYGMSYLQSITPSTCLGIQAIHQWPRTIIMGAGRYRNMSHNGKKGDIITGSVDNGRGVVTTSYTRKVSDTLSLASEYQFSSGSKESLTQVGAKYTYQTFMYSANIDSSGRVAATIDLMVTEQMRLSFSGLILHGTKDAGFGFGMSLG